MSAEIEMTETQIKHMADRFLGWHLPENFAPDGGISFKKTFNDHLPTPMKNEPTGTNLFDAEQAAAMVRYMVQGLPAGDEITRLRQLLGKARDELGIIRSILRSLPASKTAVEVDAHLSELSDEIRKLIHYPPTEREITQS